MFEPILGPRVFHTSCYIPRIGAFGEETPKRWLVVGAGQSAAEATTDLLGRNPDVIVHCVHRSSGFHIGQLGAFPNQCFLPKQVDYFHSLGIGDRTRLFEGIKATNYAGIDVDESHALYSRIYEDKIVGTEHLRMHPYSDVESISDADGDYEVVLKDVFSRARHAIVVDGIVLGTGYEQPRIPPLLAEVLPWLVFAEDGGLSIGRDYRAAMVEASDVRIFANGLSERAHGISDAQSFSVVAMRAERILTSLMERDGQMATESSMEAM